MRDTVFATKMLALLLEFHQWQIDHAEDGGRPPYGYNTLALAEWLEFEKGIKIKL